MRGTKWFCIVLGLLLIAFTVIPAPFGLLLESVLGTQVQAKVREMIEDGSLTVNAQDLAVKHGSDRGGRPSFEHAEEAHTAAALIVAWSAISSVQGLGLSVSAGTLLMGVLWIAVGIRVPSRLPVARA